jgi:membrane fusion protein, multidrug efflux system
MTERFGQKSVDSLAAQYRLTERFGQSLGASLEWMMQMENATKQDNLPAFGRFVGARGANAAKRARALEIASVAETEANPPVGLREKPEARAPTLPALADAPSAGAAPKRRPRRMALIGGALALAAGAAGWFGYHYLTVGRFIVSTDDAYVRADATTLAAKVSGYVSAVAIADNSYVHAGDVIARIDDGDYRLAAQAARDRVATQQATVGRIGQQSTAQQALVVDANAKLAAAQAVETRAESELKRQQELADKDFASKQKLEQALSLRDQAIAAVRSARAAIASAIANVGVLEAQQQEAERKLQELKTAQAKAERDLSFTVVRAPIDGVIGNRAMQVGDFVQPGQRLASLVPLGDVYIDANFKETQLSRLRPGQPVDVSVDALPDHDVKGTVASVSPATGSVFSLLPPDNATGNFTKIVQRLAVRIKVPEAVKAQRLLRPGMSVVVGVNTKSRSSVAGNGGWFSTEAAAAPAANGEFRRR